MAMQIALIAMVAANGVIGDGTDQPWHIAEDQRRFKALTTGHPLIMGRRTFEAIGRPLPRRTTLVLTRDPRWRYPAAGSVAVIPPETQVTPAVSLDDALRLAEQLPGGELVWIAGGGEVYAQALPRAHRLELTVVASPAEGNVLFPPVNPREWLLQQREDRDGFAFVSYRRVGTTER